MRKYSKTPFENMTCADFMQIYEGVNKQYPGKHPSLGYVRAPVTD